MKRKTKPATLQNGRACQGSQLKKPNIKQDILYGQSWTAEAILQMDVSISFRFNMHHIFGMNDLFWSYKN